MFQTVGIVGKWQSQNSFWCLDPFNIYIGQKCPEMLEKSFDALETKMNIWYFGCLIVEYWFARCVWTWKKFCRKASINSWLIKSNVYGSLCVLLKFLWGSYLLHKFVKLALLGFIVYRADSFWQYLLKNRFYRIIFLVFLGYSQKRRRICPRWCSELISI